MTNLQSCALYFFRIVKEQPISSGSGNQKQTAGETRLPLASGFCAADRGWIPARWWSWTGSNRRPPACKAGALPTELQPLSLRLFAAMSVVGLDGFEPSTPALSRRCSNQLSYRPLKPVYENRRLVSAGPSRRGHLVDASLPPSPATTDKREH